MISYEGLNAYLKDKNVKKSSLSSELGISSRTVAKINKGERLSRKTMEKIAAYLKCDVNSLFREITENDSIY